jgi:16S rRNA (adenine1518-N6/adenine1519-N6)-dimethyltransferase
MTKKHLGQNYLFDPLILEKIVAVSGISGKDTVVEIGPGPGRLTRLLTKTAKQVIAIELDRVLYDTLEAECAGIKNLQLIHGDALVYPFEKLDQFSVVANIPYYITTPVIFKLMEAGKNLKAMTLTVQKEVAERIAAVPGNKDYGVLSISVQYRADTELKFIIPRGAFRPVPKVDSAVIHIRMLGSPRVVPADERLFSKVFRTAFSRRRKTLSNSLKLLVPDVKDILLRAGIDHMRRPETLSIEEFARLSDAIKDDMQS